MEEVKKFESYEAYYLNHLKPRLQEVNKDLKALQELEAFNENHKQIIESIRMLKLGLLQSEHAHNQFKYNSNVLVYGEDEEAGYYVDDYKTCLSFEEYNNIALSQIYLIQTINILEDLNIEYIKLSEVNEVI